MSQAKCVEFVGFNKSPDVTDAELLAASEVMERDFLEKQPGYLGRLLVKRAAAKWADIVIWRSRNEAEMAGQKFMKSEACSGYLKCITPDGSDPTGGLHHFEVKGLYGSFLATRTSKAA